MDLAEKIVHAERIAKQQLRAMPTGVVLDDEALAAATDEERHEIHAILTARVQPRTVAP